MSNKTTKFWLDIRMIIRRIDQKYGESSNQIKINEYKNNLQNLFLNVVKNRRQSFLRP